MHFYNVCFILLFDVAQTLVKNDCKYTKTIYQSISVLKQEIHKGQNKFSFVCEVTQNHVLKEERQFVCANTKKTFKVYLAGRVRGLLATPVNCVMSRIVAMPIIIKKEITQSAQAC